MLVLLVVLIVVGVGANSFLGKPEETPVETQVQPSEQEKVDTPDTYAGEGSEAEQIESSDSAEEDKQLVIDNTASDTGIEPNASQGDPIYIDQPGIVRSRDEGETSGGTEPSTETPPEPSNSGSGSVEDGEYRDTWGKGIKAPDGYYRDSDGDIVIIPDDAYVGPGRHAEYEMLTPEEMDALGKGSGLILY